MRDPREIAAQIVFYADHAQGVHCEMFNGSITADMVLAMARTLVSDAAPPLPEGEHATWCPQCGPRVAVDEDGCCASCGADATGDGADQALAALAELERIRRELSRLSERLEDTFMGGYSDPRDLEIFRHGMGAAATCVEAVLRGERNQAPIVRPLPEGEPAPPECSDITARWCARCGDCSCDPSPDADLSDPACPLHAPSSPHGEDESAAPAPGVVLSAQPSPRPATLTVGSGMRFVVRQHGHPVLHHYTGEMRVTGIVTDDDLRRLAAIDLAVLKLVGGMWTSGLEGGERQFLFNGKHVGAVRDLLRREFGIPSERTTP